MEAMAETLEIPKMVMLEQFREEEEPPESLGLQVGLAAAAGVLL